MKIAVLGTRGIPNNYGGFEQFAEYLSKGLVEAGHHVAVYCGDDHPYREKTWNGVELIHINNPEKHTGTWGQFIYDLLCIMDSRKRDFDIVLQLGYTSSSVWGRLLPGKSIICTNMDGLEWKRTKYSRKVQRFLKYAERLAVRTSDHLIADSKGIQTYLKAEYGKNAVYIPYGTFIFRNPVQEPVGKLGLEPYKYSMLIARMEPENNIETILDGISASRSQEPFQVIGNYGNTFGKYLRQKYERDERIRFLGPVYDIELLNNLRYYSKLYFHGHTVGGTNPSLLEAIGSSALVCAHGNEFNRSILEAEAFYFNDSGDITRLLDSGVDKERYAHFVNANLGKIESLYLWPKIIKDYENYFLSVLNPKKD